MDYISRIRDFDDWKIDPNLFLVSHVGLTQSIALHPVPIVNSLGSTTGIGAPVQKLWSFTVNWEGETCWLSPPLYGFEAC